MVITVGEHMRALHEQLLADGFSRKQVLWMPDPMSAVEAAMNTVRSEDLVLIKGSQGLRMELVTEQLLVDPRTASTYLCRQSDAWRKKLPRRIPGVRLGRLAVDRQYQGTGLGELLLVDALTRAQRIYTEGGGIGLFVDAIDEQAAGYYQRFGFVASPDNPLLLFLSAKVMG